MTASRSRRAREALVFAIAADLASAGVPPVWRWHYRLTRRSAYYLWLLRRCEYWSTRSDPLARMMRLHLALRLRLLGERLGLIIPRGVFGPGLSLAHAGVVVVAPQTRAGRNCRLHQGVTLGVVAGQAPTLGDDVFVAAGAQVLGAVRIGDGVVIGANAVVVDDVPDGVTVGGVPARVLTKSGSGRFLVDGCSVAERHLATTASLLT